MIRSTLFKSVAQRLSYSKPTLRRNFGSTLRAHSHWSYKWALGASVGGILAISYGVAKGPAIAADEKAGSFDPATTVQVEGGIDPYSIEIGGAGDSRYGHQLKSEYRMFGSGFRSVTFLGFKVYAVGLYIAKDDVQKARLVLLGVPSIDEELKDPVKSVAVINKLLDEHVRFLVRITPVRNTDFGHMKDGLTKSILNHPLSKEFRDSVGSGLEELKQVITTHRGSFPKNNALILTWDVEGGLSVLYDNTKGKEVLLMGEIENPLIARILLLLYLTGQKPLSPSLRESGIDGLITIAK